MQYAGKKTRRLRLPSQFCEDEENASEICRRASRASRKLQDHIRYLLTLGMEREDELLSNEQKLKSLRSKSQAVTGEFDG